MIQVAQDGPHGGCRAGGGGSPFQALLAAAILGVPRLVATSLQPLPESSCGLSSGRPNFSFLIGTPVHWMGDLLCPTTTSRQSLVPSAKPPVSTEGHILQFHLCMSISAVPLMGGPHAPHRACQVFLGAMSEVRVFGKKRL